MQTEDGSLTKLIQCYFETWHMFAHLLLTRPALLYGGDRMTIQRAIPAHLQAEYGLLQLPAEGSLAEVRAQDRVLAKHYHPDAGG